MRVLGSKGMVDAISQITLNQIQQLRQTVFVLSFSRYFSPTLSITGIDFSAERHFRYSSIATALAFISGQSTPEPGGWAHKSRRADSNWSATSRIWGSGISCRFVEGCAELFTSNFSEH
jgi:hypothetical protein